MTIHTVIKDQRSILTHRCEVCANTWVTRQHQRLDGSYAIPECSVCAAVKAGRSLGPHPEMVEYAKISPDFRIILSQDAVLGTCYKTGKSPLETIIILADRAENMRKAASNIYRGEE